MKLPGIITFMLISISCLGQSDRDGVAGAVTDYIDAFYYGDSLKLHRSISPEVSKYGYSRPKDSSSYKGMAMSFQQMKEYIARVKARNNPSAADKFVKKVEVLDVQDQTAAAKCTAWWGTDYLLLAKHNGKWVITHVLWQSPPPQAKN
ncbi:MAG TPA: nuclear transport factor 2 family protein [Chitinophagaceae bacterium]